MQNYGKIELYFVHEDGTEFCSKFDYGTKVKKIEWDNSGRIFMCTLTRGATEGIRVLRNDGNLVQIIEDKTIEDTVWRPRHRITLDEAKAEVEIRKNFKKIVERYEDEDAQFLSDEERKKKAEMKALRDKFELFFIPRQKLCDSLQEGREKLNAYKTDESSVKVELTVEHIRSKKEEIMSSFEL